MFKHTLRLFGPLLVSFFGLISCAPDKPQSDHYVAPAPRIVKAGGSTDLKEWDRSALKDLDIQDSLDVRGGQPVGVDLVSRCRKGNVDILEATSVPGVSLIPLFQILPAEVVASDLKQQPVTCSLEITLKNAQGSKHIFNLSHAVIRDERRTKAFLLRNSEPVLNPRERISYKDIDGVKLRDSAHTIGQAGILCEDAKTKKIPFVNVADLVGFDLERMEIYPNRIQNVLEQKPLQICRVAIFKDNLIHSITPVFELLLRRPPLKVLASNLPYRTPTQAPAAIARLMQGGGLHTGEYNIINPSRVPRWVRVPKHALMTQISSPQPNQDAFSVLRPFLFISPKTGSTGPDEKAAWILTIPPQGSASVSADIRAPALTHCPMNAWINLLVDMPQAARLVEISDSGSPIGEIKFDLGPRLQISTHRPTPNQQNFKVTSFCGW